MQVDQTAVDRLFGADTGKKQRIPAWTDRVLFRAARRGAALAVGETLILLHPPLHPLLKRLLKGEEGPVE